VLNVFSFQLLGLPSTHPLFGGYFFLICGFAVFLVVFLEFFIRERACLCGLLGNVFSSFRVKWVVLLR